ncbi:MAG: AarF/UbiB family protein [Elusimicrobiota bacterium]
MRVPWVRLKKSIASLLCGGLLFSSWPASAQLALRGLPVESAPPPASAAVSPLSAGVLPPALNAPLAPAVPGAAFVPAAPAPALTPAPASALAAAPQSAPAAPTAAAVLSRTGASAAERPADAGAALASTYDGAEASASADADALGRLPGPRPKPKPLAKGMPAKPAPVAKTGVEAMAKGLVQLRRGVQSDARVVLKKELGGDVGDGAMHRDVRRVLKRLTDALGLAPESAQVFIGSSFLPNAFTTIMESEAKYLQDHASLAKAFQVSNIFLSLGLLRATKTEEQLAIVLAHELMHNLKGHLKSFNGTQALMGHFHEFEADAEALKLVARAGYDPRKAIDMLYALHDENERLQKKYALLGRDKNDILQTLQAIQDVHPHPDFRKANMLEHMNEALELYKEKETPANPVWMQRRDALDHPSHYDRLESRLMKAADAGPIEDSLHSLELNVQREFGKNKPSSEELLIIERAYRAIAERAASAEELRYVEVSARRQGIKGHSPSRRLKAALTTRQLDLAIGRKDKPTLEDFQKQAQNLGEEVRRAGTLRILGTISNRRELDAAYRALSRESENLGLDLNHMRALSGMEKHASEIEYDVTGRLWKAARKVLAAELGRPALPEEIIADLRGKISPAWFKEFYKGFYVEILETAFGPEAARSKKYTPSQLAFLMQQDRPAQFRDKAKPDGEVEFDGFTEWARRHYRPYSFSEADGKVTHVYERYYLEGLSAPSPADQLDIAWRFWKFKEDASSFNEKGVLHPPFVKLLRREGKLNQFLDAAAAGLSAVLREKLAASSTEGSRAGALKWYTERSAILLDSALKGVTDLKSIRESVETSWNQTEAVLALPEVNAAFKAESRSALADGMFAAMGKAMRQAVVQSDLAGVRPDAAEMRACSALAARIDKGLRPHAGTGLILAHARHLASDIDGEENYMQAYRLAEPDAVAAPVEPWRDVLGMTAGVWVLGAVLLWFGWPVWLGALIPAWIASLLVSGAAAGLIPATVLAWRAAQARRYARMPGAAAADVRPLNNKDFVHFMALVGDPKIDASTKVMAAALLDRLDLGMTSDKDARGELVGQHASTTVGRWLLEDAADASADARAASGLARQLLRVNALHPGFLQPDMHYRGTIGNAFRSGAAVVRRNEPLRAVIKGEHPFRGVNARWAATLLETLDRTKTWPKSIEDRLDLLDFLNSNGDFSDVVDGRILETAKGDRAGFLRWVKRDRARLKTFAVDKQLNPTESTEYGDSLAADRTMTVKTPFGDIPLPSAQPLRIVRNPALRAQLFELIPESVLTEQAHVSLRERWNILKRLYKANKLARKYFSAEFLKSMRHEGTLEEKFLQVLEESDRYASREAEEARARWDAGKLEKKKDGPYVELIVGPYEDPHKGTDRWSESPVRRWKELLPHEQNEAMARYKEAKRGEALAAMQELYKAYAASQDPALLALLENYPEPTRSRDELLERVMKSRRLTPDTLAFLESNKSYRQPNPVRVMEKNLLEAALIQMRKFTPAERVRIMLHTAGVKPLTREQERTYNKRMLHGDRKKLARDKAALRSVSQLKNYMSLMHAKDRSMLVRAQFHGETSLHGAPRVVNYMFERTVVFNRGLPPFVEKVMRAYFKVLTADEKARLLSDLAAVENVSKDLKGPEILRIALKGMGVTGAKIAQVLATHKGLLPAEYAEAFEGFKDRAQDMDKIRAFSMAGARLDGLSGKPATDGVPAPSFETLDAWAAEALPREGPAARRAIVKQVRFLLKERRGRVRSIETLGRELGSGSIKVVYKATLDDGRVWVVKLRAPGAAYSIKREFEILEQVVGTLEAQGDLNFPGTRQLLDEVKTLVSAEMDFTAEAKKEGAMRDRISARPWYVSLFGAPSPYVPKPHPVFVAEDVMIEEFVVSTRFSDLPLWSPVGPSKRAISRLAVSEGMFALVVEGWLEPDPHTGNRHARGGRLYRFWTKLVLMDLGQGEPAPVERLKPLMRAGLALDSGDAAAASKALGAIINYPTDKTSQEVLAAVESGLSGEGGVVERMMNGLLEAEKKGALVKPEYASLQKAFILYAGYAPYLPKNYLYKALERAVIVRAVQRRPIPLWSLAKLGLRRLFFGGAAARGEMEALVDAL